ncbi:WD40-repeat-containing domain protein, partial [Xylariales sp. AK1849]
TANSLFGLSSRPYTPASIREEVLGEDLLLPLAELELRKPTTFHIDFSDGEIKYLQYVARVLYGSNTQIPRRPVADLRHLYKKAVKTNRKRDIIEAHQRRYEGFEIRPPIVLTSRSPADLKNFLFDLHYRKAKQVSPHIITLSRDDLDTRGDTTRIDRVPALLYTREVVGNRAFGSIRRYEDFATAFKTEREDAFEPQMEWTNCAGDISTISWVSKTQFICGTTTHSDSHNQQYNKPGNLLLGSSQGTLRAYPDHRIIRPIVTHGDNALDSMVESQDPWLYSSVVSSDYDAHHDLAFTSSFDKTVKIWKVRDGSMEALGTWEHEGRVNFVLASKHRYGMVATAADVLTNAVRVYHIRDSLARQQGRFDSYSCTKIHEEEYVPSEKWGYCPAAIQWGVAPDVQHLLLVGYSPRSLSGDDRDIAEDRINTGELCLWDAYSRTQVKVNSLATQNVFEVAWHPSRDSFAAATSKTMSMEKIDKGIKTQIRIFARNLDGQYGTIKTLDCQAADINELAIRPNSRVYSYVAAACTNGNAYVWDTAGSDDPMCVLEHGESVEELLGEREQEDVGVKFLAWGTTADRLYTGSSDGVVKVWNIRHGKAVHVRDLIEAAGPVICGAFSPDYTKLAIGDGSGRVHLVGLDEKESEDETERPPVSGPGFFKLQLGRSQKVIRRPRPLMPHPEPPPPNANSSETKLQLGQERARGYLERGQVILNPHPNIGAVQGPNYSSTGLFRAEAHRDDDVTQPLLGAFERKQQENILYYGYRKPSRLRKIRDPQALWAVHEQNSSLDLDVKGLHPDTRAQLEADGVELDVVLNSDGSDYNSNDNESE